MDPATGNNVSLNNKRLFKVGNPHQECSKPEPKADQGPGGDKPPDYIDLWKKLTDKALKEN
jgi:hypothetical protein